MRAGIYHLAKLTLLTFCAGFTAAVVSLAIAADPRDNPRAKVEADRKMADFQRKMDEAKRYQRSVHDKLRQPNMPDAPLFDATGAPTPEECLKAFIIVARNAKSMDEIIDYVPQVQQNAIQYRQSSYDPKIAASKPPYEFFLKWYKDVADSIIDIKSVKIDGNKAKLVVSTRRNTTINGEHYGYGEADIEMIGEGSYWKLLKYKSSIAVYKEAP